MEKFTPNTSLQFSSSPLQFFFAFFPHKEKNYFSLFGANFTNKKNVKFVANLARLTSVYSEIS